MSDNKSHVEVPSKRFLTNHVVFDELLHLTYGSSILMLDETFSEAYNLLHILFQNYGISTVGKHYEIMANSSISTLSHVSDEIINVGEKGLSDISIEVNQLRQNFPSSPIIHTGLPEMLMQNTQEDILRLITSWQKNIRKNNTIEFYILPRGTFEEFERKILSIVDGGVEIRVDHSEGRFKSFLKPIRICSPENHLKDFRYKIEDKRLLIQRGDLLTDVLGEFDIEEINHRIKDYKANLRFQKILVVEKTQPESSVYDYWMLSQVHNHNLSEIKELFPEDFDYILQKIAVWQIADVVRVVQTKEIPTKNRLSSSGVSRRTKFALSLPLSLSSFLLRFRVGKTNMIPMDAFMSNSKAALAFIDMLLTKFDANNEEYMERLLEMQKRFSELGTRETAIKRTREMGENASLALDIKYFSKILALTFISGYGSKPIIRQISDEEFELTLKDCWVCVDINQTKPICSSIEGTIEGLCGSIFKKHSKCTEIECKAIGDHACVFKIVIE